MTVLEVIQRSAEFLSRKGVESPRLQVELMLAHLLGMPRMKLYLNFEKELQPTELEALREFVKRRGNREPLQHILGVTNFCGLDFRVGPQALIPRPETEILAELGWNFLKGQGDSLRALDFGVGSGCLAVTLAFKCPGAEIHALDVSEEALVLARENAVRHGMEKRVVFHHGAGFAALAAELDFNLIVSNPPYIASSEIETLEPEVKGFDPRLALDGGEDGLRLYRILAEEAGARLRAGGKLMIEFGEGQAPAISELFERQMWIVDAVLRDYTQRERFLVLSKPAVDAVRSSENGD